MTQQRHIFFSEPDLTAVASTVLTVRPCSHGIEIAVADNIARPAGGGEPRDRGIVVFSEGMALDIIGIKKKDGLTWIQLASIASFVSSGAKVTIELDAEYRRRRRRLHTAVHLAIRAAQNHFGTTPVADAQIEEDGRSAFIRFERQHPVSEADVVAIDRAMRSEVLASRRVIVTAVKSVEHAAKSYGAIFRLNERYILSGRIRLVCIDGYDANPCSGLHHSSTDIGPYELKKEIDVNRPDHFFLRIIPTKVWSYWFGHI